MLWPEREMYETACKAVKADPVFPFGAALRPRQDAQFYIAKNLAWWLTAVPFIVVGDPLDAIRRCMLLLFLNGVYYLRARTEEAHLSQDPTYVQYAQWISRHGLFRWPRR